MTAADKTSNQKPANALNAALLFMRDKLYEPVEWVWMKIWWLIGMTILQAIFAIVLAITHALVVIKIVYRAVDRVVLVVEKAFLVLALALMPLLVFIVALDRWVEAINLGWFWATKLALFLMIWVGFVGASVATKERRHLAIDVAGRVLSPKGARIANFFTQVIAAGFCFLIASYAFDLVGESLEYGDREGVLPIPTWIIQLVIPASLVVMGARFIENIFRRPVDEEQLLREGKRPPPRVLAGGSGDKPLGAKDIIIAGFFPSFLISALLILKLGGSPGWLVLIGSVMMLVMGQPLFVIIGLAVSLSIKLFGEGELVNIPVDMFDAVKKEVLLAIPLFILAGAIMTAGSIADRLIAFAKSCVGFLPGGLMVATIIACFFFAAISGSSPVTVIAIGSIMFPALIKEGYDEDRALGLVTTAGTLGILIPPSIPMIIYAIVAPSGGRALSIRELFIAGVLPGILVAVILAGYSIFKLPREKFLCKSSGFAGMGFNFRHGILSLLLILIIFAGIYLGWFTVTEAAAVAVVYALAVDLLVHRDLKIKKAIEVFIESAWMMGTIFMLLVLAIAFNKFLTEQEIPQAAAAWLKTAVSSKVGFLLLVNLFLLLLGCLMDIMSAIMIVGPLLAPIAAQYGIDPIHFGLIFIVNLSIGYITPPIGLNLFVSGTVLNRPIVQVIRASFPYAVIMLLALAAVTYVPALSLGLLGR